jgi:pyrroline-5-carboxylate reductase
MEKNGKKALVILGYGTIGSLLADSAKDNYGLYIVNRSAKEGADFNSLSLVPADPAITAIVLSTKPQDIRENLENGNWQKDIHRLLNGNPDSFGVSTAAGIKTGWLQQEIGTDKTGKDIEFIRTMSNTAAQVNQGVVGLYATPNATKKMRQTAENLYRENSLCLWVEIEEDLDAVTAVSGSGTGFVYYMMEALMENQKLSLDDAIKAVRDAANNDKKKSPLHQTYQANYLSHLLFALKIIPLSYIYLITQ